MNILTLENFRCFRDEQQVRLTPLTLLVGENSTGKTSFMALVRALWDAAYMGMAPDFKEAPYDLGSFDEIAHYRGGRAGRAPGFRAGLMNWRTKTTESDNQVHFRRFEVAFSRQGTAPAPTRWMYEQDSNGIMIHLREDVPWEIHYMTARGEWSWQAPAEQAARFGMNRSLLPYFILYPVLEENGLLKPVGNSPKMTSDDRLLMEWLYDQFDSTFSGQRPFASAPVRSKPRRTYDPSRPARDPEGETIPMYLSTTFFEDKKSWKELKDALERFGREAGLFDEIAVKPLGKRGSEPFQMHVRKFGRRAKKGPLRNLIDVGYGVSQVLPVITELFRDDATPMFLLQQPEVHLHPSAQAALGSLFCRIAGKQRQLVVETHSDHLLDRVRMDVRDRRAKLTPDDVSILFFERGDLDVKIHSLRLDQDGNVLGAPPGYRQFFMDETKRSLNL